MQWVLLQSYIFASEMSAACRCTQRAIELSAFGWSTCACGLGLDLEFSIRAHIARAVKVSDDG